MEISQPLAELDWIPRPRLLALRRLGIETVEDLVTHFPRRHEDRHQFPEFPREESDTPICLCGEVIKTSLRRLEENFRGDPSGADGQRAEPAARLSLVQLTLHPKDDRHRSAAGGFW